MATVPSFPNFEHDKNKTRHTGKSKPELLIKPGEVVEMEIDIARLECKNSQNREQTYPETVRRYEDAYKANYNVPFIDVVYDPDLDVFYIWDGHHRFHALTNIKRRTAWCKVRIGTLEYARFLGCGANKDHGLPRTREDERRAIVWMLRHPDYTKWTNKAIAKHVGCSESVVGHVRRNTGFDAVTDGPRERVTIDKDGKEKPIVVVAAKRKLKSSEAESRQSRLFPTASAATPAKTSLSPLTEFLRSLDAKGLKYQTQLDTAIGPIPVYVESLGEIYWVGGVMSAQAVVHAAAWMRLLRRLMPKRGCRIVIVGTPANPDAQACMNLASEEFEVVFRPIGK